MRNRKLRINEGLKLSVTPETWLRRTLTDEWTSLRRSSRFIRDTGEALARAIELRVPNLKFAKSNHPIRSIVWQGIIQYGKRSLLKYMFQQFRNIKALNITENPFEIEERDRSFIMQLILYGRSVRVLLSSFHSTHEYVPSEENFHRHVFFFFFKERQRLDGQLSLWEI